MTRRAIIMVCVALVAVVVAAPAIHAAHTHGPAEETGSNGFSAKCALCSAGYSFFAAFSNAPVAALEHEFAAAVPPAPEFEFCSPAPTRIDSRAPPVRPS